MDCVCANILEPRRLLSRPLSDLPNSEWTQSDEQQRSHPIAPVITRRIVSLRQGSGKQAHLAGFSAGITNRKNPARMFFATSAFLTSRGVMIVRWGSEPRRTPIAGKSWAASFSRPPGGARFHLRLPRAILILAAQSSREILEGQFICAASAAAALLQAMRIAIYARLHPHDRESRAPCLQWRTRGAYACQ